MQNATDLVHVGKLIQQYTADAEDARRRADTERLRADQEAKDNPDNRQYFEKEAVRFDQKASEFESWVGQLQTQKAQFESHLAELESQRAKEEADHIERLRQIDQEIARTRGSGLML